MVRLSASKLMPTLTMGSPHMANRAGYSLRSICFMAAAADLFIFSSKRYNALSVRITISTRPVGVRTSTSMFSYCANRQKKSLCPQVAVSVASFPCPCQLYACKYSHFLSKMSYVLIKTQVILLFCLSPVLHRREPKLAANYPENIYVHNLLEICIVSIFGRDTTKHPQKSMST